jgi:hypothetical protein
MRFVDDEHLLLSRTGRPSQGLHQRLAQASERHARDVEAVRLARAGEPRAPLVVRIPLPRPIHFVPRSRN